MAQGHQWQRTHPASSLKQGCRLACQQLVSQWVSVRRAYPLAFRLLRAFCVKLGLACVQSVRTSSGTCTGEWQQVENEQALE